PVPAQPHQRRRGRRSRPRSERHSNSGGPHVTIPNPATATSRAALLRNVVADARKVLDGTMADVTQTQADYAPPGIANPLGATYAHVVCSEDMVVQGMFRQLPPLFASSWQGRTGLSEPMPLPGPEWVNYA